MTVYHCCRLRMKCFVRQAPNEQSIWVGRLQLVQPKYKITNLKPDLNSVWSDLTKNSARNHHMATFYSFVDVPFPSLISIAISSLQADLYSFACRRPVSCLRILVDLHRTGLHPSVRSLLEHQERSACSIVQPFGMLRQPVNPQKTKCVSNNALVGSRGFQVLPIRKPKKQTCCSIRHPSEVSIIIVSMPSLLFCVDGHTLVGVYPK